MLSLPAPSAVIYCFRAFEISLKRRKFNLGVNFRIGHELSGIGVFVKAESLSMTRDGRDGFPLSLEIHENIYRFNYHKRVERLVAA